jgi:energy-coupling factor transport system permease protein
MPGTFDLYVHRHTGLHRLDPRVKFAFVVEAVFFLFLWPSLWVAMGVILVCFLLARWARVPAAQLAGVARTLAPLMALVFVLTALFGGGPSRILFLIGPLPVTVGAVWQGLLLASRLLALALIFFLWLATTDQASMVRGFLALGMPYTWGLTLALALRYLPIFAGLFEQVCDAQRARGLNLEQRGFWQRLQAYRPVLVAMVISALRNSERLGWALESRALGAAGVRRTVFRPLRLRRADLLGFALLLAVLAAALALRIS